MGLFTRGRNGHDPTLNVRELFEAGTKRQDDLRDQEREHSREVGNLRASQAKEIREGESSRINAILAAAALSVTQAAIAARAEAATLASGTATIAETLRGQVEATKNAFASSIATTVAPITKRLDELTQTQYQQQGERLAYAEGKDTNQWVISSIILGTSVLIAAATFFAFRQQGARQIRTDDKNVNQWLVTTVVTVIALGATLTLAMSGHLH